MKYIDEFRDQKKIQKVINKIKDYSVHDISLMEFCGGHTVAILKYGIRQVMPAGVVMLSGPGCPICVTDNSELDKAMEYAMLDRVILSTYGDMLRVPGSYKSLSQLKAEGARVVFVYSPSDALKLAKNNKESIVIFFGVGFETSAPALAATVLKAKSDRVDNFYVYSALKLTPVAARAILHMAEVKIHGILGPGHVTTIIGLDAWSFIPSEFNIPVVVSGFEPLDILLSLDMLLTQVAKKKAHLENEYARSVTAQGNLKALEIMYQVFEIKDCAWRGFGILSKSGLKLKEEFSDFDAEKNFVIPLKPVHHNPGCKCAEVLRGVLTPSECPLFKQACTPAQPIGPCMVSPEGSCAAYYYYGK